MYNGVNMILFSACAACGALVATEFFALASLTTDLDYVRAYTSRAQVLFPFQFFAGAPPFPGSRTWVWFSSRWTSPLSSW